MRGTVKHNLLLHAFQNVYGWLCPHRRAKHCGGEILVYLLPEGGYHVRPVNPVSRHTATQLEGVVLRNHALDKLALNLLNSFNHIPNLALQERNSRALSGRAIRPQEAEVIRHVRRREGQVCLGRVVPEVLQIDAVLADDGEMLLVDATVVTR